MADTIFNSSGPTPALVVAGLQTALDAFQWSLISHKLVLNSNKMKWMLFSRSPRADTV